MDHSTANDVRSAPPANGSATTYLGPAEVCERQGTRLRVRLAHGEQPIVTATLALTFPFEPAIGDSLLVLGQGTAHYVVGVLSSNRPTKLAFHGDTDIRAIQGKLTLTSDQAVELQSPRITMRAGVLRTIATNVVEKSDSFRRWVRGLFAMRAGQSRRIVDGEDSTRCQNATTLAKDTVKIDGDQLHLGH